MSPAINTSTSASTVGQLGEQAAQAIRVLNHLTRPAMGALSDPIEAAELVAALAYLSGGLPQLLGQISGWLLGQQQAGRMRVDAFSPCPDPAAATDAVTGHLARAAQCANGAGRALDTAHQHLAHLAASATSEQENRP